MNIYPYISKTTTRADGSYPVFIRVSRPPRAFMVGTGVVAKYLLIKRTFDPREPNHGSKTVAIKNYLDQIEDICLNNPQMPDRELKALIETRVFQKSGGEARRKTFVSLMRQYAETKQPTTRTMYLQTAKHVEAYDPKVTIEGITVAWLNNFEAYLQPTNKVNSISAHMHKIRATINWCIDNEWTNSYPFRRYKIKVEETRMRNLSLEEFRLLMNVNTKHSQKLAVDMFLLSFFLIGINPQDMFTLKKTDYTNGRIQYRRKKTKKIYNIKVEPEAQALIEEYKASENSEFLLNVLESGQEPHVLNSKLNAVLKTLGEYERKMKNSKPSSQLIRAYFPELSMYWARYSWANFAQDLDIPKDVISSSLGHHFGNPTTTIYLKHDQKKVDEANRRVIDYVLGK